MSLNSIGPADRRAGAGAGGGAARAEGKSIKQNQFTNKKKRKKKAACLAHTIGHMRVIPSAFQLIIIIIFFPSNSQIVAHFLPRIECIYTWHFLHPFTSERSLVGQPDDSFRQERGPSFGRLCFDERRSKVGASLLATPTREGSDCSATLPHAGLRSALKFIKLVADVALSRARSSYQIRTDPGAGTS